MSEGTNAYDASHIQVLEGREAVRKRPGMYIGSTGERGLRHLVFEVADRAVNEVLAGHASCVDVTLMPDGGVCVADDGPGVPIDQTEGVGGPGLEALLTRMQFGSGPGGRHDVTLGFCGVGPFVVNALSSRLTADVQREGARWVQEYARGVAVTPLTEAGSTTGSGTTITFWPDADIFTASEFSFDALAERFRELAFLNRDLEISLTDQRRPPESPSVRFRFPSGARDFVAFLDGQAATAGDPGIISFEHEDPQMAGTVEVALRWRDTDEERVQSFANSRPTGGGTHERGFRDGVAAAVNTYARKRQLLAVTDPDLDADRVGVGLTAVVSVKLDDPEFHGAIRDVLGNATVRPCVEQAVQEHLGRWLEGHPERAAAVIDRIVHGAHRY
ncbi:ATP-binding protein [Streptomyces sp. NRRL S-350]|uniref:ATP-binding protein n=1 Tax=Streptomyces sp. NRRL S-350 TaxID=1463902 RepID=UPI0004BF3F2A|nr:ATP-binding protein [Streptomyces sp. NRRL S-350]